MSSPPPSQRSYLSLTNSEFYIKTSPIPMKIPHIKLEIRILFHWLHLSGKLCHQVREGKRLGLVEIIIFSSTISQGTVSMSLSGVECDPVDIYFSLVPPLTGLATTIFLIVIQSRPAVW